MMKYTLTEAAALLGHNRSTLRGRAFRQGIVEKHDGIVYIDESNVPQLAAPTTLQFLPKYDPGLEGLVLVSRLSFSLGIKWIQAMGSIIAERKPVFAHHVPSRVHCAYIRKEDQELKSVPPKSQDPQKVIEEVSRAVSLVFSIPISAICSTSVAREVVQAREVLMLSCATRGVGLQDLAGFLRKDDSSTRRLIIRGACRAEGLRRYLDEVSTMGTHDGLDRDIRALSEKLKTGHREGFLLYMDSLLYDKKRCNPIKVAYGLGVISGSEVLNKKVRDILNKHGMHNEVTRMCMQIKGFRG